MDKNQIARDIAKALDDISEASLFNNDQAFLSSAMEKLFFLIEQLCDTDEEIERITSKAYPSKALAKALARTGRGIKGPYKRGMWKGRGVDTPAIPS